MSGYGRGRIRAHEVCVSRMEEECVGCGVEEGCIIKLC